MYTEIQAKNCPLSRSRNKKQDPRQQHNTPIKQYNFRNISINSVQDAYMYLYIYITGSKPIFQPYEAILCKHSV